MTEQEPVNIIRLESRPGVCVGYQVNGANGTRFVQPIGAPGYVIPAPEPEPEPVAPPSQLGRPSDGRSRREGHGALQFLGIRY
ncbi:MAG: hypothetical protein RL094_544 [Candidatus Parcubacteria bacterium]|jgi:hypothetical protein